MPWSLCFLCLPLLFTICLARVPPAGWTPPAPLPRPGAAPGPPLEQCRTPSGATRVRSLLCICLESPLPPSQAQMGPWPSPLQGTSKGGFVDRNVSYRRQGWAQDSSAFQTASLFTPGLGLFGKDSSELSWEPGRSGGPSLFGFMRALCKVNSVLLGTSLAPFGAPTYSVCSGGIL